MLVRFGPETRWPFGMNPAPVPAVAEGQMAEVVERVAKLEEQYDAIMQRFDRVDGDLARVEGRLDAGLAEVNRRLDVGLTEVKHSITRVEGLLDAGLVRLEGRGDASIAEVKHLITRLDDRLESRFNWMMGGIASAVLASALTFIGQVFGK